MFYSDFRYGEDPLAFLMDLETTLTWLPHLSESEKCEHFYLRCKLDSDVEDWYENLKKKLTSSRYLLVNPRFTFLSEMALSFPEFITRNPKNNSSNY